MQKSDNAICIYINDNYILPFKAFFRSLYLTNPSYKDLDVVVMYETLSEKSQTEVGLEISNPIFMPIDLENYKTIDTLCVLYKYLACTFHKLDVFRIRGYEKVLMIDTDMLVYRKFEPCLFDFEGEILMCDDGIRNMFNSGLVIIDKVHLNDEVYKGVLELAKLNPKLPDQVVINDYFKGRIKRLPHRYNVTAPILKFIKRDRIVIFHYAGVRKPWDKDGIVRNRFFADWKRFAKSQGLI